MNLQRDIFITESDLERLDRLVSGSKKSPNTDRLKSELERAVVVTSGEIPSDVVTMNSRIIFKELDSDEEMEITLVYPSESDVNSRKISILTPVGSALLGLRAGDIIDWPLPSGKICTYRVISVLYQPEADGRYDL
ncbi:MAG: nucleoside diphosphate kinase regulator [Syntrophales bacterium]